MILSAMKAHIPIVRAWLEHQRGRAHLVSTQVTESGVRVCNRGHRRGDAEVTVFSFESSLNVQLKLCDSVIA